MTRNEKTQVWIIVVCIALVMLSGCAHEDRWTRTDTGLYGASAGNYDRFAKGCN